MSKRGVARRPGEDPVRDSSIAPARCFPDEKDGYSQTVLDPLATRRGIVPDLWHLEVANVLLAGERRGRSTRADTVQWMSFLGSLPLAVDDETRTHAFNTIADLGRTHGLSSYDAAYLELALRRGLPLATLDNKLKKAAEAVGVDVFGVKG